MQTSPNIQTIADLLKENKCCIFIGAGIPNTIGFPLWKEFAKDLVKIVWNNRKNISVRFGMSNKDLLEDLIEKGKFSEVIQHCQDALKNVGGKNIYQEEIYKIFYNEKKYNDAISCDVYNELLNMLSYSLIIQTNIDRSFEHYSKIHSILNVSLDSNLNSLSLPQIVYLHGEVTQPETWILTSEEYDDFYLRNDKFKLFIKNVFESYDILFLGYSLNDRQVLDRLAEARGLGQKRILVLGEKDKDDKYNYYFERILRKNYDIQVFRYNIENEGYEAFSKFLRELNDLMKPPLIKAKLGQVGSTLDG